MSSLWEKICDVKIASHDILEEAMFKEYIHPSSGLSDGISRILSDQLSLASSKNLIPFGRIKEHIDELIEIISLDLIAFHERDFASGGLHEVLLLNRCFHALALHRVGHFMWNHGQSFTAKWLTNTTSILFGMDIHPAAQLGSAVVFDHGFGVVIGETSIIGDNSFIFHNVTLGGTGKSDGDRHPKINANVFIGAGATVLGNISIGKGSVIAAGAMVLKDVPSGVVVAGNPAIIKGCAVELQQKTLPKG
ncbi:MAG: serine O-acetyltransferase [Ekhidna sp.]